MERISLLGVILLVVISVHAFNISTDHCDSNEDCLPYGCCLAAFVNDKEGKCESLGKSGDPCDTTLSVSVPAVEGDEVAAKNKYLGHCPCSKGLDCAQEYNVSQCVSATKSL